MEKNLFGICPYFTIQKLLSGKWSIYILYLLSQETLRFNELQRRIPDSITHTSLSRQLKALEENGLIIRTEYNEIPPKVEYSLSPSGRKFDLVLNSLRDFGLNYIEDNSKHL